MIQFGHGPDPSGEAKPCRRNKFLSACLKIFAFFEQSWAFVISGRRARADREASQRDDNENLPKLLLWFFGPVCYSFKSKLRFLNLTLLSLGSSVRFHAEFKWHFVQRNHVDPKHAKFDKQNQSEKKTCNPCPNLRLSKHCVWLFCVCDFLCVYFEFRVLGWIPATAVSGVSFVRFIFD